jgi:hypothetical protein
VGGLLVEQVVEDDDLVLDLESQRVRAEKAFVFGFQLIPHKLGELGGDLGL